MINWVESLASCIELFPTDPSLDNCKSCILLEEVLKKSMREEPFKSEVNKLIQARVDSLENAIIYGWGVPRYYWADK